MDISDRRAAREARVLEARAALEAAGKCPTAAAIACRLGWSSFLAEDTVRRLRDRGLWPDSPIPVRPRRDYNAHASGGTGQEEPDIATLCAEIRGDWNAARWARQAGDRAPVRVAKGIDHHQRLVTHKYGS